MRRDQPKTPEPMRGTLPNTDQPRIPNSEYHHTPSVTLELRNTPEKHNQTKGHYYYEYYYFIFAI